MSATRISGDAGLIEQIAAYLPMPLQSGVKLATSLNGHILKMTESFSRVQRLIIKEKKEGKEAAAREEAARIELLLEIWRKQKQAEERRRERSRAPSPEREGDEEPTILSLDDIAFLNWDLDEVLAGEEDATTGTENDGDE